MTADLKRACDQFKAARALRRCANGLSDHAVERDIHRSVCNLVRAARAARILALESARGAGFTLPMETPTMMRAVAKLPVRAVNLKRDSDKGPGVLTVEQPDGKGSFKLNLSPSQCCDIEGAGELNLILERRLQDGQH